MTAANLNFEVEQGATWKHELQVNSGDSALDLTGFIARMQFRERVESEEATINITNGQGITITPATGGISLILSASETGALTAGSYFYDLEIESSDGEVTRVIAGTVEVSRQITR